MGQLLEEQWRSKLEEWVYGVGQLLEEVKRLKLEA